jgi:hypothetical protein
MPLNIDAPIRNWDISSVCILKRGKVFKIIGFQGDSLVLKVDNADNVLSKVKPANTVMKAVDPRVKVKVLKPEELAELDRFITDFDDMCEFFAEMTDLKADYVPRDAKAAVAQLTKTLKVPASAWTKMQTLDLRDLEGAIESAGAGNGESPLKIFAKALSSTGGLEKLGEIVAADAFIGNTDRFSSDLNPKPRKIGPYTILLKSLVNVGNVFIALNPSGKYEPLPLDFLDPYGPFERMERLGTLEKDAQNPRIWPGRVLATKELRAAYAEKIAEDLENLLNPTGRRLFFPMLGFCAASRVQRGMVSAMRKIRARLQQKYPGGWPPAFRDRFNVLDGLE